MLSLNGVEAGYGKARVLKGISLSVPQGQVVALLGANGAGKTTTLRTISGLVPVSKGEILLGGERLNSLKPEVIVQKGISHVPEGRDIFPEFTVMENLEVGAYIRRSREEVERDFRRVFSVFPILQKRRKQMAGTLSGGEQQMLAIARGLMSDPKILMMDEPSLGLAPLLVEEVFRTIKEINEVGKVTIFLVEQNAFKALRVAHYGYIMALGTFAAQGTKGDLIQNELVRKVYLGIT